MCALAKFLNAACQSSGTVIRLFRAGSKSACTIVQRVGAAAELINTVLQSADILRCCGRLIRQLLQTAAKAGCQLICTSLEGRKTVIQLLLFRLGFIGIQRLVNAGMNLVEAALRAVKSGKKRIQSRINTLLQNIQTRVDRFGFAHDLGHLLDPLKIIGITLPLIRAVDGRLHILQCADRGVGFNLCLLRSLQTLFSLLKRLLCLRNRLAALSCLCNKNRALIERVLHFIQFTYRHAGKACLRTLYIFCIFRSGTAGICVL